MDPIYASIYCDKLRKYKNIFVYLYFININDLLL